jgi:hypothetical protein
MARKSKIIIPYTDGLEYFIPEPERDEDIINFDIKSKKDQFWKRPPIPNFKLMTNEEKDEYFIRELKRSTQGAHFLNNGKVEFLAPVHYWFLNHWDLGGGRYPDFYKWHQYLGWFMHKCRMDEDCFGGLVLTSKRAGKSEFIPCEFQVDAMTQTKAEYIIQAQNDIKAKKLFRRSTAAFYSLKRSLPYLYSYYTTKNEIMFKNVGEAKKTSTKKSSAKDIEEDFAVSDHVAIGAYPSKIDFVQGEATRGYFLDEFCSQELMDLQELHLKVLAQCSKGIGSKIIGKAWWVATPENAESKALSYSEQMWRDSDIAKRDKNGRTASGLYRMLVPYYASTPDFIDKYGYSDEDAAKEFFKNKCEGKSQSVINTLRRQYIASEDDAFIPIQSESLEQDVVEILVEQDKILTNHKLEIPYQYCFLYEENGEIKKSQKSVSINNTEEQDKWVEISEDPQPNVTYIIGVDGTNTDKMTSENGDKKSKYAIVVLKLFEHIDKINYTDVCNYSVVPDKMENLTKMVYAITMHYNKFGRASVMAEGNVGVGAAIVSYFDNKGMLKLIRKQPKIFGTDTREVKNRYTVYADEHVNRETLRLANLWCRRHGKNFRSRRLVKAILKIGSGNSDLGSAFRVALLGCGNFDPETIKKKEVPVARKRRQVLTYVNGTYMYTYV